MQIANVRLTLCLALVFFLSACQQWGYDAERNPGTTASRTPPELHHYDVPPQVVYRIDDHRFVTLEGYNHCLGYGWYNDTRTGVRTRIGLMWPTGFRGKLIIDDPTGMNVAIPRVSRNVCGDRGCIDYVAYSTDGGRTFNWTQYDIHDHSFDPVADSDRYSVVVTKDSMYVTMFRRKYKPIHGTQAPANPDAFDPQDGPSITDRFPLAPGYIYGMEAKLPEGVGIQFNATLPSGTRTPSGAERYTCDETIHDPAASQ